MQGTQYAPRESILCMEHFVALQSMQFFIMVIVLILSDLKGDTRQHFWCKNNHFVVCFLIDHVYNKVKYKHILLNALKYTPLDSLFHFKKKAVFDRHQATIFPKIRCISSD